MVHSCSKTICSRHLLMSMGMIYFFPAMTFSKALSIRLFGIYSHMITEVRNKDNISELERLISIHII